MKINFLILPLLILVIVFFGCTQSEESGIFSTNSNYPEELQQLHNNVLINILADSADLLEVEQLLATLSIEGSWSDIDYTSKERGAWQPRQHLSNLLAISKVYRTPGTKFYGKQEVSEKIHLGLNYWLDNDFICPNWWYPVIGVPMMLNPIMILMEDEISDEQLEKSLVILDRCKIGKTGQNKVWQSGNVLLKSLLLQHIDTVQMAANSIQEELKVSLDEGVQPDWSYHQHGPQLQFGNYGLSYVGDMIKWITILRNTPFSFDESNVSILRNYLLEGQQWVTWKNQMDISACGRQLFVDSPETKAQSLSRSINKMETLDPAYAEAYATANDYVALVGNKHFWRSDIQIQRTNNYYFSVKMCSERVIGAESCNSENIQGYYMGDGATFLYQTGEEYRNIFPFLDWKKIPGTTTQQDDDPLPVLTASGYRIESDFVGGVSDGEHGVAALDYNRNGLTARKSWFMMDGMIICLGNGISSKRGQDVTTSVNQSHLNSPVIIKSEGLKAEESQKLLNPEWILHDNIGYIFPNGGSLTLDTNQVEGSWNWVASRYPDERLQRGIFKLWFDHGINPVHQDYQYVIMPNASEPKINEIYTSNPYQIKNTKNLQQVISKDGTVAGLVFYEAGKSEFFGGVEVSDPCVMMAENKTDKVEISIADPTQKLKSIQIMLKGKFNGNGAKSERNGTSIRVELPTGGQTGNTVQVTLVRI